MNEIHFIGYSATHTQDFIYDFPNGHDFYLLLLVTSPAIFKLNDGLQEYPANTAILYPPNHPIYYQACTQEYRNDWVRFQSTETFVTEFPLQGVPFSVSDSEYCHNIFKLLTWETSFMSPNNTLIISQLLSILFLKLYEDSSNKIETPHAHDLITLRKRIYNSPQLSWNINQMADELHLSAGYLQILYKKMFQISCMDDVIEGRIRMAKEQLIYTTKTIHEIADYCGYNNIEHFCRQFRQNTSVSPSSFRKSSYEEKTSLIVSHETIAGPFVK